MNFSVLLALFIVIPLLELGVLLRATESLGWLNTIALIALTGIVGASLARWQGLQTISLIMRDLSEGRMPAPRLIDALLIVVAGAFLVTPGFITDAAGFLLLVPAFRNMVKQQIKRRLEIKFQQNLY